jgi:Big-like domain-containing protein
VRLSRLGWVGLFGLVLLTLLPVSAATAPLHGVVTTCSSNWSCDFVFNTSAGHGWANGTSSGYLYAGTMSMKLPGESITSTNLTYWTFIERLNGTWTYWTIGHFFGTDVNTGKVVYGTTNSNYTITCHGHSGRGGGCTYTYTTDNGTIVFHFTKAELTSTTVSCTPSSIQVSAKTTCTVKVTNLWNSSKIPTGKVQLSSAGLGTFANSGTCTLVSGKCSLTFHPSDNTGGSVTISATYAGSSAFYKSAGSTSVYVNGGG